MTFVRIGCCGFAGKRDSYFRRFPLIEMQQTFFEPPRVLTAEAWRREPRETFAFTLKAWQVITHDATAPTYSRMNASVRPRNTAAVGNFKPTKEVWGAWQRTREIAAALQARVVLFTSPPNFLLTSEHKENMQRFFKAASEDLQRQQQRLALAWGPPADWPDAEVAVLCQELGLVHQVDPFLRQTVTADKFYFHLNGRKGYRHSYTDEELLQLAELTDRFRTGYVLFNNLPMREDAIRFSALMRQRREAAQAASGLPVTAEAGASPTPTPPGASPPPAAMLPGGPPARAHLNAETGASAP